MKVSIIILLLSLISLNSWAGDAYSKGEATEKMQKKPRK